MTDEKDRLIESLRTTVEVDLAYQRSLERELADRSIPQIFEDMLKSVEGIESKARHLALRLREELDND